VPGTYSPEAVYAKHQPEYIPLPAWREPDGTVVTRWRATLAERLRILFTGDLWLTMLTFNQPLQPVKLTASCPVSLPDIGDAPEEFEDLEVYEDLEIVQDLDEEVM
jgi:hypothetical protein